MHPNYISNTDIDNTGLLHLCYKNDEMRKYLQTNDMLWKLQWNSCQWYDIRTVHLRGCYQMQAVCCKFTMAVMGTATMNAMYNFSIFLLLPMDIVCSRYVYGAEVDTN